jgi:hypothetical protein
LTLVSKGNKKTFYDIKVVSCTDSAGLTVRSEVMTEKFQVIPGPQVVLSFQIEGDVKAADLTGERREQIVVGIAQVMGVDRMRITSVQISDARRRLLAINLGISIAVESEAAATKLSYKAQQSDFSAAVAGIPGARVGGVQVSGVYLYIYLSL